MNRDGMISFLIGCIAKTYKADESELSENTNIPETFGTKSLQRMALLSSIENETDVMISLGDLGKYPTIGNLADMIIEEM